MDISSPLASSKVKRPIRHGWHSVAPLIAASWPGGQGSHSCLEGNKTTETLTIFIGQCLGASFLRQYRMTNTKQDDESSPCLSTSKSHKLHHDETFIFWLAGGGVFDDLSLRDEYNPGLHGWQSTGQLFPKRALSTATLAVMFRYAPGGQEPHIAGWMVLPKSHNITVQAQASCKARTKHSGPFPV